MPRIELTLDDDAYRKLEAYATSERRLPDAQAEVLVLMGLNLWPVKKGPAPATTKSRKVAVTNHRPELQDA